MIRRMNFGVRTGERFDLGNVGSRKSILGDRSKCRAGDKPKKLSSLVGRRETDIRRFDLLAFPLAELRIKKGIKFLASSDPVTVAQYSLFLQDTGFEEQLENSRGEDLERSFSTDPEQGLQKIVRICLRDAARFIQWLNKETGGSYRLPTNDEADAILRTLDKESPIWTEEDGLSYSYGRDKAKRIDSPELANRIPSYLYLIETNE